MKIIGMVLTHEQYEIIKIVLKYEKCKHDIKLKLIIIGPYS